MADLDYWEECLALAAEEGDIALSKEQLTYLAEAVSGGHENYGMAFYSPPSSERVSAIEREWEAKCKVLQAEFDAYKERAERAVKKALRQDSDANVSIDENGDIYRYGGRTEQIQ